MKRLLTILIVCGFAAVALTVNASGETKTPGNKLIVHEWGTFTGFAGSDGVHLPFGIAIGSELPPFVISRRVQAERLHAKINPWGDGGKGEGIFALQRMETPVIYFYTPQARWVNVAVDFPKGFLTEFYPPVRAMGPAFGVGPGEARYLERPQLPLAAKPTTQPAKFERGSLDWGEILIVPQVADERPTYMPEVPKTAAAGVHYKYARETDAATVQFSDRPGEYHNERFLFYRGLGDFTLPVTLKANNDERFEMTNSGGDPISSALLLNVADGRARFAIYTDITGRQSMTLPPASESVSTDQVGDAIAVALVREGLFEKEARAMVKTWSSNWLGDTGTRVLYIVPRPITDSLLPLRITPAPDENVRVLVGRIDLLTPQQEARIESLLASALDKNKTLAADDAAFLRTFGRFLDPALQRAGQLRGGAAVKNEISTLRWQFYNAPQPQSPPAPAAVSAATH